MKVIDWREMTLDGGILRERESDEGRLIVWLPSENGGDSRSWERVGNVARGDITADGGLCSTPATRIQARRSTQGIFGKLLGRFGEGKAKRSFVLPSGESVEQCGERAVDCLLVWPEDPAEDLDEERVQIAVARCPATSEDRAAAVPGRRVGDAGRVAGRYDGRGRAVAGRTGTRGSRPSRCWSPLAGQATGPRKSRR